MSASVGSRIPPSGGQLAHSRYAAPHSPTGIMPRPLTQVSPGTAPFSTPLPRRMQSIPSFATPFSAGTCAKNEITTPVQVGSIMMEGQGDEKATEKTSSTRRTNSVSHRSLGGSMSVSSLSVSHSASTQALVNDDSLQYAPTLVRAQASTGLRNEDAFSHRLLGMSMSSIPVIQVTPDTKGNSIFPPPGESTPRLEHPQSVMLEWLQDQVASIWLQLLSREREMASLHAETQSLSFKFDSLANDLLVSRAECRSLSGQLCTDVEARLTPQIAEFQKNLQADLEADTRRTILGAGLTDQIEALGSPDDEPSPELPTEVSLSGSPEDEPSRTATLVNEISDHVIERVNSDPRICQLVESHKAIQESFAKLMCMLDKPRIDREKKDSRNVLTLYDTVFDTQKRCKAIDVELRKLRQRRNQDSSDSEVRFDDLERKLQAMIGNLAPNITPEPRVANFNDSDTIRSVGGINETCVEQDRRFGIGTIEEKEATGA